MEKQWKWNPPQPSEPTTLLTREKMKISFPFLDSLCGCQKIAVRTIWCTKLTDAEQAEFMELIKDSFDPELYTEDDLPRLRANKKKWEEEQQREEAFQADESSGEELGTEDCWSAFSHWDYR